MSFQWSISTDRLFRRCQRQFFFREIAASHAARDWRREAFILKQLKTLELWRGTVIHEGIQHYLVPALKRGAPLDWASLTRQTLGRAKEQLAFSEERNYRKDGMVKGKEAHFCALIPHETGRGVSKAEFAEVCDEIRAAFQRLEQMSDLWTELLGRKDLHPEEQMWVSFDDVRIMVQLDLLFERKLDHPTIIDWKSYEIGGDTGARLQMVLYGWALWHKKRFSVAKPEDIELLECQVQDGVVIRHECSQEVFDELEDYIYRSIHRIYSLCRSKKLADARLEDFAFTDNPNNCEYCAFQRLCVERASRSPSRPAVAQGKGVKRKLERPAIQPSLL
jgi:hypothetical protein